MSGVRIVHTAADRQRASAIGEALRAAGIDVADADDAPADSSLSLVCWSQAAAADPAVIDQADGAKARGAYFGVLLDKTDLPFGFGGLQQADLSAWNGSAGAMAAIDLAEAVRARIESGSSGVMALPTLVERSKEKKGRSPLLIGAVAAVLILLAAAFFYVRSGAPTLQDRVAGQFDTIPCAWLGIDPVQNGDDGRLTLTGVAGNPAVAGETIRRFAKRAGLPIATVSIDKVAQIDPRECAAIEAPIRLRKGPGARLKVTGEPFILNTKVTPHQALVRIDIALADQDKSLALLGIEPTGKVTWSIPDIEMMRELKKSGAEIVENGDKNWEFSIYPDHLGWTGLLLIVGDGPLAQKQPPQTVQSSADFARTITAATRSGKWDAEMVWFRVDPDPAR